MDSQPKRELTAAERRDCLRLIRSENVGPITYYQLMRLYGSAAAALEALPELSRRGGRRRPIRICPAAKADDELAAIEAAGARLVAHGEPDYPDLLGAIEDAPPVITLIGHAPLLARRMIAVVGARNASANGRRFASRIAAELGEADFVVVSGLARGIDAAAHQGALESGTVAVVAGGVEVVYPEENAELRAEIAGRGVIVAEQPVGTVPQSRHFPRRNRLISGVSMGVLIVEAAPRSGSLITARMALEQGREVFAVLCGVKARSPAENKACIVFRCVVRWCVTPPEDIAHGQKVRTAPLRPAAGQGFLCHHGNTSPSPAPLP